MGCGAACLHQYGRGLCLAQPGLLRMDAREELATLAGLHHEQVAALQRLGQRRAWRGYTQGTWSSGCGLGARGCGLDACG